MTTLRDIAETMLENYRISTEFNTVRQVVLRCLSATWGESSTSQRFAELSGPLAGQYVDQQLIVAELFKMRRAGLIRTRKQSGVTLYELNLPL